MSRRMNRSLATAMLITAIAAVLAPPMAPLRGEPPSAHFLELNATNPHYFAWRGKPTILVTSGEHYGAVLNLDFDYVAYLDELHAHGLNLTRTFSGAYREDATAFQITDNTLAPRPNRFICPWARSDQPGYHGGGNRFDLTRWDDAYFKRLKDFLAQADQRGIVVELDLFCPMYEDSMWIDSPMHTANNINGIGNCPRNEVHTLKHDGLLGVQLALTRKLVAELRDFGNLYYEVCNEPYFGGVTIEWQHAVVDTIVDAERQFAKRHLISMNVANGRQKVEKAHAAVSIFNFHYCVPPDTVAMNYALGKVIGENETGFRGKDDLLYRTEGWDFLLAGGALYNNLDYSFTAAHPRGTLSDYQSPGGGSVDLRRQLGILKRFLEEFDFVQMRPDHDVVRGISPKLTTTALSQPGRAYAICVHVPLDAHPKRLQDSLKDNVEAVIAVDLPAGEFVVDWIDTKTGQTVKTERLRHEGGERELTSPRFANDVALRIRSPSNR